MPDVFSDPPVLRTERLVLRQITESDGEGLFGIFADDQVTEFYAWDRVTDVGQGHELAARTAGKFRQREAIRWGLVLARDYWRRGLMSEAVAAVLRFGFEQMALHRVEATVLTGNTASAALLGRAGFEREGVLRGRCLKREAFGDVWMFGLPRADWAAPASRTGSHTGRLDHPPDSHRHAPDWAGYVHGWIVAGSGSRVARDILGFCPRFGRGPRKFRDGPQRLP